MEVTSIQDGIIIDHVPAGTALKVLDYLSINRTGTARKTSSRSRTRTRRSTLMCWGWWRARPRWM